MRLRLPITVFAAVLLFGAAAAHAQDDAAKFRADVDKLLTVTRAAAIGAQIAQSVAASVIDGMRQQNPEIPERAVAVVKEALNEEFTKAFSGPNGMQIGIAELYMKHFTHKEVIALLEFYQTAVGQKMIDVMPQLTQESMQLAQQWMNVNGPAMLQRLQQRMKAEGIIK